MLELYVLPVLVLHLPIFVLLWMIHQLKLDRGISKV